MEHLLEAARLEAQKIERPLADAEIRVGMSRIRVTIDALASEGLRLPVTAARWSRGCGANSPACFRIPPTAPNGPVPIARRA